MAESFEDLPIKDGVGPYHVNQFRVHFSDPNASGDPRLHVPKLASEFISNFSRYFNGFDKGLVKNRATVAQTIEKHKGKATLKFVLDFKSEALGINLPDLHSDWVCVEWKDPAKGFAGQTLKRDLHWYENIPLTGSPLEHIFKHYNRYHFLAGRRSWVFGVVDSALPGWASKSVVIGKTEGGKFTPHAGPQKPVFFLETAAVERYSLLAYRLMEYDPGLLVNIRKAIVDIWSILLSNYVTSRRFTLNVGLPTAWVSDDGNNLWGKSPRQGVYYRQAAIESAAAVYAKQWIQHLYGLHPALKAQQLEEIRFKGFGGGSSGGGGASGSW